MIMFGVKGESLVDAWPKPASCLGRQRAGGVEGWSETERQCKRGRGRRTETESEGGAGDERE